MTFSIDTFIFISFLAVTLIVGILSSKGIANIRDYAVGDKKFNTATLVATIVATWVGGDFFFAGLIETYSQGLGFIAFIFFADFFVLFIVGYVFAPRMQEFIGKISIAEAMGDLYGNNVRIITAFSGLVAASGLIAIQLQMAGELFQYSLGISNFYGIIFSGLVITLYSSLGGIKSVTFTDVIQFITFGIVIPFIAYLLLNNTPNNAVILDTIHNNPSFNPNIVFSTQNPKLYYLIYISIYAVIPSFNPAVFQRIAMGRDVEQVKNSFMIASFFCIGISLLICWIGILALTLYPNMETNQIFKHMLADFDWIYGFKGLLLAGILAMVMSTIDSYINSTSVLVIHDLQNALRSQKVRQVADTKLKATRICSAIIGLVAIILAMRSGSFLDLFIWASMFYMPVVTVPFILAVLGFRSTGKSVIIAMFFGFSVAMIWELFFKIHNVGGLIPGMLANLITLFSFHHLTNQPGGWINTNSHAKNFSC